MKAVLKGIVITEKTALLEGNGVYTFRVAPSANKIDVKQAVESLYDVKVDKVSIQNVRAKKRQIGRGRELSKRKKYKKAVVYLGGKSKELDLTKFKK